MLQQANLELQLIVGCGKFSGSLRDPLIEFVGDPLLFAQEPCLMQPDRRLIRRYAQKKPLGLPGEIRSLRPCDDDADFTLQPQPQGHDRNVSVSNRIPSRARPFLWIISQPAVEQLADLLRPRLRFSRLSDPDHLDGRLAGRVFQSHIDEIQVEHA